MDRIDLHIEVNPVPYEELSNKSKGEKSCEIRTRVVQARAIQIQRFRDQPGVHSNAQITPRLQEKHCKIDAAGEAVLKMAMNRLGLSARSYGRIFKVARTIADLDGSSTIASKHIAEAIQYRSLDREGWLN